MTHLVSHHAVRAGMTIRQAKRVQAGIQARVHLALVAGIVALAQATVVLQVHQAGINYELVN